MCRTQIPPKTIPQQAPRVCERSEALDQFAAASLSGQIGAQIQALFNELLVLLCHKCFLSRARQCRHRPRRAMSWKLSSWRRVAIEWAMCRCARRAAARDVIAGKGRHLACDEVFFWCRHCARRPDAQRPGSHRRRSSNWRGDETRAILALRNGPARVPASVPGSHARYASAPPGLALRIRTHN